MFLEKTSINYIPLKESFELNDWGAHSAPFNSRDIFLCLASIFFYICNIGIDAILSYCYYLNGSEEYFILTFSFTLIPAIVVTSISCLWYFHDWKIGRKYQLSKIELIIFTVLHVCQLAPISRYLMELKYEYKRSRESQNEEKHCETISVKKDVSLLRLLHVILESAPQVTLQLFIIAKTYQVIRWDHNTASIAGVPHDFIWHEKSEFLFNKRSFMKNDNSETRSLLVAFQISSILSSLVSLAWALTIYKRSIRLSRKDKINWSCCTYPCYFLWQFLIITARILAIALFTSVFSFWIAFGCLVRWIVIILWIIRISYKRMKENHFCTDFLFKCLIGLIYLYSFSKVLDEPNKVKFMFFYCYEFLENCVYISLWLHFGDRHVWFYYSALVLFWSCILVGLLFMNLYYGLFHPTKNVNIFRCFERPLVENPKKIKELLSHQKSRQIQEIELIQISKANISES